MTDPRLGRRGAFLYGLLDAFNLEKDQYADRAANNHTPFTRVRQFDRAEQAPRREVTPTRQRGRVYRQCRNVCPC